MQRYLVIFSSHAEPPSDATVVDVSAESHVAAIAAAHRDVEIPHPWAIANAIPWPEGCPDVEVVVTKLAAR